MNDRVQFVEGDLLKNDLDGPYDGVLCFQIIHHLTPEQNADLLRHVHAALVPGGTLAILDYFAPPHDRLPDSAAFLGLHFYLTSTAATYRAEDLRAWLRKAGFTQPRRVPVRRVPIQTLYETRKC